MSLPSRIRLLPAALALVLLSASPIAARPEGKAATLEGTSLAGNYLSARLAGALRENAAAANFFRAALRSDSKNPEVVERAFLVMLAQGDIDGAAGLSERLVQLDRQHRIARLTIAIRAIKSRNFAMARTQLAQSVRTPIADLTATLLAAWTSSGAGDVKTALELLDKLRGPDWYATFRDLHAGLILDLAGQGKEAGKRLERALKADPTALRVVDAYARWASRNGQRDEALKTYAGFLKLVPQHPLVIEAMDSLQKGRSLPPLVRSAQEGAAEVLYGLGSALGRQGGEDLALIYLQFALYLAPQHQLGLFSLADLYETLKKPELAIEAYSRIAANSPLKRNAEIQLAADLDQIDRSAEARQHLETLLQSDPGDIDAVIGLGNLLRGRKQFGDAVTVYSRGIERLKAPERRNWLIYYFRGICYERIKDWPKAEADFKKALELYPDQPHVLNYLGYSWIDQGIHLDTAMEMIRRAVQLRPDDGYIVDSLGWAHYRLGRYDDAVAELERAIELKPDDPVINDHLGDAYWQVGRHREAMFQWSHAREMKPEPEDLQRIEAKLQQTSAAALVAMLGVAKPQPQDTPAVTPVVATPRSPEASASPQTAEPRSVEQTSGSPPEAAQKNEPDAKPVAPESAPQVTNVQPTPAPTVPMTTIISRLDDLAASKGRRLNWRSSVVDLMCAFGMNYDFESRQQLARQLQYRGNLADSRGMNIWLHQQLLIRFTESGGKLPLKLTP